MDNINEKVALYSSESSFSHTVSKSGVLVMGQGLLNGVTTGFVIIFTPI
jgi:hypothetical protein